MLESLVIGAFVGLLIARFGVEIAPWIMIAAGLVLWL